MPAAQVREATGIPGTSVRTTWLCRDKPSMKEALRQAGVPTAASAAVDSAAEAHEFADREGYPLILKPRAGAGAQGTVRVDDEHELAPCAAGLRARGRHVDRHRGVRRGPRGLLRHDHPRRPGRARLGHALLPQRPRGDAPPLDLAAVHHDEPHRRPEQRLLRRGARARSPRHRGARHRDVSDPHGVVLRPEGPEVQRDRRPPAGCRRVGPLLRRQRGRRLSRVGARHHARPPRAADEAHVCRRHRRAAPRPRRRGDRLQRHRRDPGPARRLHHRRALPARGSRHAVRRGRLHGQRVGARSPPRLRHGRGPSSTTSGRRSACTRVDDDDSPWAATVHDDRGRHCALARSRRSDRDDQLRVGGARERGRRAGRPPRRSRRQPPAAPPDDGRPRQGRALRRRRSALPRPAGRAPRLLRHPAAGGHRRRAGGRAPLVAPRDRADGPRVRDRGRARRRRLVCRRARRPLPLGPRHGPP